MEEVLLELLHRLEVVRDSHEELGYTDVKAAMCDAVFNGFIKPEPGYILPETFHFDTPEGDNKLREVLKWFLLAAAEKAELDNLDTLQKRLQVFQAFYRQLLALQERSDPAVQETDYYDFFGLFNPEQYGEAGSVVRRE